MKKIVVICVLCNKTFENVREKSALCMEQVQWWDQFQQWHFIVCAQHIKDTQDGKRHASTYLSLAVEPTRLQKRQGVPAGWSQHPSSWLLQGLALTDPPVGWHLSAHYSLVDLSDCLKTSFVPSEKVTPPSALSLLEMRSSSAKWHLLYGKNGFSKYKSYERKCLCSDRGWAPLSASANRRHWFWSRERGFVLSSELTLEHWTRTSAAGKNLSSVHLHNSVLILLWANVSATRI